MEYDPALDQDADGLTLSEKDQLSEAEPEIPPVVYQARDFQVDGLVQRLNNGYIKIPRFGHNDPEITTPGFQRSFVWKKEQMDRFIESLLLGYPVPGIFLVNQEDNKYLVLDGQQRLLTLQKFYAGLHDGKEFRLVNVNNSLKNFTYDSLPLDLRLKLDNSFFNATVVEPTGSDNDMEAVYQIFERLNAGGTPLTPHEIRVALYSGPFIDYLENLNLNQYWRELYGKPSPRIRDQELVLRILALFTSGDRYFTPLKTFLNSFTKENRYYSDDVELRSAGELFKQASKLLQESVGRSALKTSGYTINAAKTEAIFVGLMKRLAAGYQISAEGIKDVISELDENINFLLTIDGSTASTTAVGTRLAAAINAFAGA